MEFYQTKKLENNKTNQNSEETAYKTEYVLTVYPIVTIQIKTKLKNRIKDLSRLFPPKYPNDQQVYENFLKTTYYQQKIREVLYHTGHNDSFEVGQQLLSRR